MRYISIFSGIEGATVAWEPLGWEPVAFSEIDKFPSAVLEHRFPNVPNLGDITKIDWSPYHGAVDLVVGGSPCQSFSIAGGRESLDGESRLMFEYLRCVDEVRPRWVLWENVPGVLNTKDDAFWQLLDTLGQIGYTDLAYRVLDAQFFGLAQRRQRVYVVGRLGSVGYRSAAVLFERGSVSGNHPSSREKRAQLAGASEERTGVQGEPIAFDTVQITHRENRSNPQEGDPSPTLHSREAPSICVQGGGETSLTTHGLGFSDELSYTINGTDRHAVITMTDTQSKSSWGELPTITAHSQKDAPVVCFAGTERCG